MDSSRGTPLGAGELAVWRRCASHEIGVLRARYVEQVFPRHFHDTYVVCVDERGAHSSWYRGERVIVPEGTLAIVPPGEVHTGQRVPGWPWHYRAVYPSVDLMATLAQDAGLSDTPSLGSLCVTDRGLANRFVRAHRRWEEDADPLAAEGAMVEVLATLLRRHGAGPRPRSDPRPPARCAQVLVAYLHDCFAQRITLDDLARSTALTRYAVLRVFRREIGIPPYRFLTQVRVERAKRLLQAGLPAAAVAQQVGFADQSHLTRHFRRLVGVTPGAFARAR
jgi:AraC-like DNA-binding protein